jgi:surface antigen
MAVALAAALSAGGCSLSYQLDSMARTRDAKTEHTAERTTAHTTAHAMGAEQTASVRASTEQLPPTLAASSGAGAPKAASPSSATDGDIAATRLALNEALTKTGKDFSVPWENPSTGARGTVTPLSASYSNNGATCRDFLASYVRNGSESWMQGEACRGQQGRWEVRHMKPWRRT